MTPKDSDRDPKELYQERVERIADTVALKETDRVPYIYLTRFWNAKLVDMTSKETMYDVEKSISSNRKAIELLQPDAFGAANYAYGQALEKLDYHPLEWPGGGAAADDVCFQYIDKELMVPDEYDEYLFDPTAFYLQKYLPRIATGFEGLKHFPNFPTLSEWNIIYNLRAFANPELQESFKTLMEVGEMVDHSMTKMTEFIKEMMEAGYPMAIGGFCKAPYDHIVDFLRGSKGGMLDMFRHKDKLLETIDKARLLLNTNVVEGAKLVGCPYVFIPLHWGLDGFMSPDQFNEFYWPSLRQTIHDLIDAEMTPVILWEGDCTTRLEFIGDIPPGKAIYWFERTDLHTTKDVLGDVVCLRGNVPPSLLNTGTVDEVNAYCKDLIEYVGKGGGFILDGAASITDEAPIENVVAMAESVRKYANK